ncbi:MAG: metallophosphoesterase [Thermoplasmata archaeon]|nr:metallophosphoesterase [Thermoplasmata archaeon]
MRLLFTSDLHGNAGLYERLASQSARLSPDAVVIGGDLFPAGASTDQPAFLRDVVEPAVTAMAVPVYVIPGNNDHRATWDLVGDSGLMVDANGRTIDIGGGWRLFGYGFVDVTPFPLKDWEKFDDADRTNDDDRYDGYVTWPERRSVVLDPADRSDTIERDLAGLAPEDPERTIMAFHAPPHGTPLDVVERGHVGSLAIRAFIERHQPPLSLHGHVHEAPHRSGQWWARLGRTVCINPGQAPPELHAVLVDMDGRTARHTTFDGVAALS